MKRIAIVILILVGLTGCGMGQKISKWEIFEGNPIQKPMCRHTAILAAATAEGYDTRIATWTMPSGEKHAQAQVFYNGEWRWLIVHPTPRVLFGDREYRNDMDVDMTKLAERIGVVGEIEYRDWYDFAVDLWMRGTKK